MKPAQFDRNHSWFGFKYHSDACTALDNWNYKEKDLFLAVSLGGAAQGILGNGSAETGQQVRLAS